MATSIDAGISLLPKRNLRWRFDMSHLKADLIRYRMERAHESLKEAAIMADTGHWRTCINRVYYSCFYAVSALLLKNSLSTVKHSGVLSLFNRHFVQLGLISKNHGKLYNRLFLYRQQSDYQDLFTIDEPMIKEWLADAKVFVADISKLIDLGE